MKNIDIIAPASRISRNDVNKTKAFLREQRYQVTFPKFKPDLVCSADTAHRVLEFKKAFSSPDSDFIWCLRGGYGSHQILSYLKKSDFKQRKSLMGFSDCTSLHYYLNQILDIPSIHGPHPNSFIKEHSPKVLKETLGFVNNSNNMSPVFKGLKRFNSVGKKNIKANLVGGNLTTLQSVIGTIYDKGVRGRILFLEEIDEPAYKINRMLEHMEQSSFLKGVKAVVFGSFTHRNKREFLKVNRFLKEWAKKQSFPVLGGMSAGHIKMNRPFWLGKKSLLELDLPLDQKASLHNNI